MKTISTKALIFPITLALGLLTISCSESLSVQGGSTPKESTETAAVSNLKEEQPQAKTVSHTSVTPTQSQEKRSTFNKALDQGMSAAVMGQTAISLEDWQLVAQQWQGAIALLKTVPSSDRNHKQAQNKIQEYEANLGVAQSKVFQYQRNYFQEALNSGRRAANGASVAKNAQDWERVIQNWQQGIKHLQTVSKTNPNYNKAQNKISEYENNLAIAQYRHKQYLYREDPCLLVAQEANSSQLVELNKVNFSPNSLGERNYITGCITNHSGKTLKNVSVTYNYFDLSTYDGRILGPKNSSLTLAKNTIQPGQTVTFELNSSMDEDILYVELTSLSSEVGRIPLYIQVGG